MWRPQKFTHLSEIFDWSVMKISIGLIKGKKNRKRSGKWWSFPWVKFLMKIIFRHIPNHPVHLGLDRLTYRYFGSWRRWRRLWFDVALHDFILMQVKIFRNFFGCFMFRDASVTGCHITVFRFVWKVMGFIHSTINCRTFFALWQCQNWRIFLVATDWETSYN